VGGRERESERKRRKSERHGVVGKEFLAAVINLILGLISQAIDG
jgi:hypothetical protein